MSEKPYIGYPGMGKASGATGGPGSETLVSEPGKVSYGSLDFAPHFVRSMHRHNTWELIIIDGSSEGPGYIFFDGKWWKVTPGAGVFVPKGYSHSWSSGQSRFKMLWVYGGSRDEAGRVYDVAEKDAKPITPEEEKNAQLWTGEKA